MNYPENTAMQDCSDGCRALPVIKVTDMIFKINHLWNINSNLGQTIPTPIDTIPFG